MRKSLSFFSVLFILTGHASPGVIAGYEASVYLNDSSSTGVQSIITDRLPFTVAHPTILLQDSTRIDTSFHHTWKRATIWSACLPGSGQIYNEIGYRKVQGKANRAWWKAPIIYGALGVTGYYFYQNLALARSLKAEWIYRDKYGDSLVLYPEFSTWDKDQLLNGTTVPKLDANGNQLYDVNGTPLFKQLPGFDLAAKRRDILGFAFVAIWGLNVVEALVDGHFVHFDISEDLSLDWSPIMLNQTTPGVYLRLGIN